MAVSGPVAMKPTRQVECVVMVATNNITVAYAQALVAATPANMLVGETKPRSRADGKDGARDG